MISETMSSGRRKEASGIGQASVCGAMPMLVAFVRMSLSAMEARRSSVSSPVQLHGDGREPVKGRAFAVKDPDLFHAVQGRLHENGGGRAAAAKKSHHLARQGKTGFFGCPHIAGAVGGVTGQDAVVIDDGVDGAADLRGRRELVGQLAHEILVRHGQVPASGAHGAQTFHGFLEPVRAHVEAEISIVKTQRFERCVMHQGGDAVGDRASQKTGEYSGSCDSI